ncbi:hypothetical protein ATANTOWER_001364, partial [Ataeniobius toweri]|nr:hypothetical protein [Ataeniobius toweri]
RRGRWHHPPTSLSEPVLDASQFLHLDQHGSRPQPPLQSPSSLSATPISSTSRRRRCSQRGAPVPVPEGLDDDFICSPEGHAKTYVPIPKGRTVTSSLLPECPFDVFTPAPRSRTSPQASGQILVKSSSFTTLEDECFINLHQYQEGFAEILHLIKGSVPSVYGNNGHSKAAAKLPMSIIIVGVGQAEFDAMVELDGDDIRISSRGKLAERDIVQFVPFRDYMDRTGNHVLSMARLAKDVLAEIPDQFISYMKSRGIKPNPAPPPYTPPGHTHHHTQI